MFEFLSQLLDQQGFMPHGHCYLWRDDVLWLHLIGDGLTVLAYFLIPGMLFYFVRVRRDIRYRTVFYLFGLFIITCGTSHLISMFTIWDPVYRLESLVKMMTGLVSISTSAYLLVLMPKAQRIPTIVQLEALNLRLAEEVAQHKATSEDLRASEAKLTHHVQELETVNQELEMFIYSVAHDLRAPLRHVIGYAELLEEAQPEDTSQQEPSSLQQISQSAGQMGHLIDALLQFSRTRNQPLHFSTVDLSAMVERIQAGLTQEASDRTIEWEIQPLPQVTGDATMVEQVFTNLLSNAVKFTQQEPVARIQVGVTQTEEEYHFSVSDNGVGFDMAYQEKLFSLFERLHRQSDFPGHGVGLANVKRILERHGGSIAAEGEPEKGATIRFTLPRKPQQ